MNLKKIILVLVITALGFAIGYGLCINNGKSLNNDDGNSTKYNIDSESEGEDIDIEKKEDDETKEENEIQEEKVDNDKGSENKTEGIKESLPDDVEIEQENAQMKAESKFKFSISSGTDELEFGTPWKKNDSKDKSVAIDGRGPDAIEEGEGKILINIDGESKSLSLSEGGKNLAPKYVEWYDNDNFMIYMVNRYGRVFTGGTLYMVNAESMKPIIIYKSGENEEISEATKINADIINIKILNHESNTTVSSEKNIKIK